MNAPAAPTVAPPPPLPAAATQPSAHPMLGVAAVLFGSFIATLNGRLSTLGVADIRGALGFSVDEGAWITTAQTVAQMLIGPIAVWLGSVLGPRRVLLGGCVAFATASMLIPFSRNLETLLSMQFIAGLGSGCFVPLTITFLLRNLPPRYWAMGIAVYALQLEASLNISATVEAFYVEHASWAWIFWQNVPLAVAMAVCVHWGIPLQPIDHAAARRADHFGMASAAIGFSLIYAALDQGNRLDWTASPLVVGLLAGGGAMVVAFIVHELTTDAPWIDLRMLAGGYLPIALLVVCGIRFASLVVAFLVPQFLLVVRGFRPHEIGPVLLWVAVPQLVVGPLAAWLLRSFDARAVAFAGFTLVGSACWYVAEHLTAQWSAGDFLVSQLVQALGQTLAISAAIFAGVLHLKPAEAPTFGVLIQVARLFGGELGFAFVVTFVRKTEQLASHLFGTHVQAGATDTLARLQATAAAMASHAESAGVAGARALGLLAQQVRQQANLQAYAEGFAMIAAGTLATMVVLVILEPPPPGPASPSSPFARMRWGRR